MTARLLFILQSGFIQLFISLLFFVTRVHNGVPLEKAAAMFLFAFVLGFIVTLLISTIIPNRKL